MKRVSRWLVVLSALMGALTLGAGGASASVAPTGFLADPSPGPSSKCVEIRGATGCYRAYGDVFTVFDTAADGHHARVTGYYLTDDDWRPTTPCQAFRGNGTSETCAHPEIPERTSVCLVVAVMEGSKVVRDTYMDGFQNKECFPTT